MGLPVHEWRLAGGSNSSPPDCGMIKTLLLTFACKMTRPVNLFALYSGLPLVGLGSFAVQTSIGWLLGILTW